MKLRYLLALGLLSACGSNPLPVRTNRGRVNRGRVLQNVQPFPVLHVPDNDRVVTRSRYHMSAIRGERDHVNILVVALQSFCRLCSDRRRSKYSRECGKQGEPPHGSYPGKCCRQVT